MSAPAITMRMLEPALRHLAADPDIKVSKAAAKHVPAGVDPSDYCAAIWLWFKQHNASKRQVSSTRIDSALTREGPAIVIPPAAKANIQKAIDRPARVPSVNLKALPGANSAPNSAPAAEADPFDKDDGSSPWTKRPRRPRKTAVDYWRSRLVAIANGDKAGLAGSAGGAWWACKRKWFGTATPAPKMVERFLAWFDAGDETVKPAPFKFTVQEVKTPPGRLGTVARALAAAPTPPPATTDGWEEIAPACGGHADYDARFTGSDTKTKRLGFTKRASGRLAKLGFAVGKFVRIHWNGQSRQLALSLAPKGFKIRAGRDALAIAGAGLVPMLGENPLEFVEAPAVNGFAVVLSVKGGAS